ncbi:hypothetical protein GC1_04675 [Leisingera sp. ANG1]|nr:hypothetical protein RA23_07465 [Leisingera sp. ANG-S3]KIC54221.1 hypothetical protein RA22_06080 [Leisingera sp. ANG-S]KID10958.1 hypothetical protein GC1_04675 [Leisingera sp. ANG1]
MELIDQELSRVVQEADLYNDRVGKNDASVLDDFLSTTSILSLSKKHLKSPNGKLISQHIPFSEEESDLLIHELSKFGILTVGQLDTLLDEFLKEDFSTFFWENLRFIGAVRMAMVWKNPDRFLREAYWGQYSFSDEEIQDLEDEFDLPGLLEKFRTAGVDFD